MKIVNFKANNMLKFGTFWDENTIVDINAVGNLLPAIDYEEVADIKSLLERDGNFEIIKRIITELKELENTDSIDFANIVSECFYDLKKITIQAPLYNPEKIVCLGRNFAEHAKEGGKEPPKNPMIWGKFNSCIIAHNETIILPKISDKVDVEIELVVVIGKEGKNIPENKAMEHVAGYTIGNDVSARDYQYSDKQFTRAKTMDTFGPIGPWIVTPDEIEDPQNLNLELKVNGKTWQKSNTKHMIFSIPYIISYLSKSFTFKPGDLIFTGTPSGVGHYQKPPQYLKAGDTVSLTIDRIGTLENPVKEE